MASSMRAAVVRGPGEIGIEEIPRPDPGPGEVRVQVDACGLCGSDLHLFGSGFFAPGTTPGHEITGRVEALGAGVKGLSEGDRVAVEPIHSCGACDTCARGLHAICPESQLYGVARQGGFAEYVSIAAHRLFRAPGDLEPAVAALAEPMAVVVHGLRRGSFEAGQRVLVLGAGTIGLLAAQAAVALGAGDVWITARHEHQAQLARRLGASRVLSESEASAESLAQLGIDSPFDLVVETVGGQADTLRDAGHAVRRGGVVSVVGVFMGDVTIPALSLFMKENALVFSNCYTHPKESPDFEKAVDLVAAHRGDLAGVTTHSIPLDEVERAFAVASDKKTGAVKVTLHP